MLRSRSLTVRHHCNEEVDKQDERHDCEGVVERKPQEEVANLHAGHHLERGVLKEREVDALAHE